MTDRKEMLFTNKALMRIILPLALQGILAVAIGMVDSMMISGKGEAAFAGVSLIGSLDTVLITLFASLASGGSVVLAQALGRGDRDRACAAAKQLTYLATAVAALITATVLIFRVPLLRLLFGEVEESVMKNALDYFFFMAMSFPFLAIQNSAAAILRAQGNSMISLVTSIFMNLVNIGGNAILIYGVNLGSAGAAIATLFSRVVGAVVMLFVVMSPRRQIHIRKLFRYRPDWGILKAIMRIGIPNGVEDSMFQAGRLVTASLISTLGTASIAANAAVLQLANFQYTVGGSIQGTKIAVVGRCVGAEKPEQAKHYAWKLLGIGCVMVFLTDVILCLLSSPLLGLFHLTPDAFELARQLLFYHSLISVILWTVAFCLPSSFRAAGDVRFTMVIAVFSMWLFRVASAYVFALETVSVFGLFSFPGLGFGLFGVYFAMTLDWFFRAAVFLGRLISKKWLTKYRKM